MAIWVNQYLWSFSYLKLINYNWEMFLLISDRISEQDITESEINISIKRIIMPYIFRYSSLVY